MGQVIYIKSILKYTDNNGLIRRLGFEVGEQKIHNFQNIETSFMYTYEDQKSIFHIVSIFKYQLGKKAHEAFLNLVQSEHKDFPLRHSGNGVIQNFIDTNVNEWNRPKLYFNTIRWLHNIDLVSENTITSWSIDKVHWYHLYDMWINGVTVENTRNFDLPILSKLAERNRFEPLPFEILNEAKATMFSTPRVALIVAAMALEIGVKQFIKIKSPHTEWILDNIQSPPVVKLLSELVITLEPNLNFSLETISALKRLVSDRNQAIHLGMFDGTTKNAPKMGRMMHNQISLVSDVLYYLAYHSGHYWIKMGTHINEKRILADL